MTLNATVRRGYPAPPRRQRPCRLRRKSAKCDNDRKTRAPRSTRAKWRTPAAGLSRNSGSLWALPSNSRSSSTAKRSSASPSHFLSRKAARCSSGRSAACWKSASTASGDGSGMFLDLREPFHEPRADVPPVPVERALRHAEHRCRLVHRQAGEVAEQDYLKLERVALRVHSMLRERQALPRRAAPGRASLVQLFAGCPPPCFAASLRRIAPRGCLASPGLRRRRSAGGLRRSGHSRQQFEIGLVNQRGGRERLALRLSGHACPGELVQFGIHQRQQLVGAGRQIEPPEAPSRRGSRPRETPSSPKNKSREHRKSFSRS